MILEALQKHLGKRIDQIFHEETESMKLNFEWAGGKKANVEWWESLAFLEKTLERKQDHSRL